jgi:hypothetical protein
MSFETLDVSSPEQIVWIRAAAGPQASHSSSATAGICGPESLAVGPAAAAMRLMEVRADAGGRSASASPVVLLMPVLR